MTLEDLQVRKQQLNLAITNTTQSVFLLQGHLAEVDFQISELQRLAEEADKVNQPVVNPDAPDVE